MPSVPRFLRRSGRNLRPARVTGRVDGVLRPGAAADIVILDDRLEIRAVFVGGKELVGVG